MSTSRSILPPSRNALYNVSRQIYQESCSIYYGKNLFQFASGVQVRTFVEAVQPVYIQSMQKITVHGGPGGIPLKAVFNYCDIVRHRKNGMSGSCRMQEYGNTRVTCLLGRFHGLKELYVEPFPSCPTFDYRFYQGADKGLMKALVGHSRDLVHLRKIILSTAVLNEDFAGCREFSLDHGDTPSWAHLGKYDPYVDLSVCNVVECLERVREPWWLLSDGQKRRNREDEDKVVEKAMAFFSVEVS